MVSLLKCLGKVVEKLVAEFVTEWRFVVDAVLCLIGEMEHALGKYEIGQSLFMDIKGVFDHVVGSKRIRGLWEAELDGDLICWVAFFLTNDGCFLLLMVTQA